MQHKYIMQHYTK